MLMPVPERSAAKGYTKTDPLSLHFLAMNHGGFPTPKCPRGLVAKTRPGLGATMFWPRPGP